MIEDTPLRVLGIDGPSGRPLDAVPAAEARRRAEDALRRPRPTRYGVVDGDLASAGWGVVLPEGADAEVRDALGPLLARRRRQAGELYRELTYRNGEGVTEFRNRLRSGLGRVDPRQLPWYLLLVGDPTQLPHGFELDLDVPHAVGRLAFDNVEDLAAYARRVVRAEERPGKPGQSRPRALLFAPTHPDDVSTAICQEHLAHPLARLLRARETTCRAILAEDATRDKLLQTMTEASDLLFIVAHSVVFPSNHRCQRTRQGAVICADWPGPVRWPEAIPSSHTVAATDLPPRTLDDGVAVLFGCHTAGTPRRDLYDSEDLEQARELTPQPFVAAMAERLLGRDGGALAVIGHVGRAYEASCFWRGAPQSAPFEDAVRAVLDGRRLGEALDGFGQRFADLAVTWASSQMEPETVEADPLDLWIAFHDARSWSLLGDPAVRLPSAMKGTKE